MLRSSKTEWLNVWEERGISRSAGLWGFLITASFIFFLSSQFLMSDIILDLKKILSSRFMLLLLLFIADWSFTEWAFHINRFLQRWLSHTGLRWQEGLLLSKCPLLFFFLLSSSLFVVKSGGLRRLHPWDSFTLFLASFMQHKSTQSHPPTHTQNKLKS